MTDRSRGPARVAVALAALAAGALVLRSADGEPQAEGHGRPLGTVRVDPARGAADGASPEGGRSTPPPSKPASPDGLAPGPSVDKALVEHAAAAAPAWRDAAEILAHSPHPELQALATGFAARLDAAASGIDAPTRQELINEERQLLHFLKSRYAGLTPLERALEPAERSLDRLQAAQAAAGVGPSPRPPGAPTGP